MAEHEGAEPASTPRAGDRRGPDRRAGDRRARDRRTPVPPWRSPLALVAYGVLGALAAVMIYNGATSEPAPDVQDEPVAVRADSAAVVVETPATTGGVESAEGAEGFDRLVVGGEASVGRVARAELFCGAASNFAIVAGHPTARSVSELIQDGRVPAAECKWGRSSEGQSRPELLLLIPPDRAEEFASAPVVTDNYVERRRLIAEVEWVGRSETLALRTGAVLRRRVGP